LTLSLRPIYFSAVNVQTTPLSVRFFPRGYLRRVYNVHKYRYIYSNVFVFFFLHRFAIRRSFFSSILFDLYRYSIRVILLLLFVIIIIIRYCEHSVFVGGQINSSRDLRGHRVVTISRWWVVHAAAASNRSNFAPTTVYTPTLSLPNHLHVYLTTKTTLPVTSTST